MQPHCRTFAPSPPINCFCLVVQRCVPPSHPLSTGCHTPQTLPGVTLQPQQLLLAGQIHTHRPQKVHPHPKEPQLTTVRHMQYKYLTAVGWPFHSCRQPLDLIAACAVEPTFLPFQETHLPFMPPLRTTLHPPLLTDWLSQLRSTHLPHPPRRVVHWAHPLFPFHRQPSPPCLMQTLRQTRTPPKVIGLTSMCMHKRTHQELVH